MDPFTPLPEMGIVECLYEILDAVVFYHEKNKMNEKHAQALQAPKRQCSLFSKLPKVKKKKTQTCLNPAKHR